MYVPGSNEAPIPGSHGLTKSWMQSHSAAKELITSKRQSPMTETAQHSTIDSGTGKERSERSRSPGAQRSKSHRIQSKRNFSTASLSNVNDCNPCLNGVRNCSTGTGAGGIPGGNPRMSRFNRVRVDQALGSVKDLQKAQAVKFDAADKRVRKRSYSAPLSIRGWTSKSLGGLSVGAPDPKGVVDYKGLVTSLLLLVMLIDSLYEAFVLEKILYLKLASDRTVGLNITKIFAVFMKILWQHFSL